MSSKEAVSLHLPSGKSNYPKIVQSEDEKYELKTEGIQGWGGYTLIYYRRRVEDKEWTTKEDAYFLCNCADGDVHGYYKARLDNDKIIFSQYSDYDDILRYSL